MKTRIGIAVAAVAATCAAFAETLADLPVSAVANKAYLTAMPDRPWWDKAWKRRAPILVSNMTAKRIPQTTIDFVFDVGEEVDPASVRVVTPWETEVECVAERVRRTDKSVRSGKDGKCFSLNGQECPFSGSVRILFQTELRERENRPFFVYYNRQGEDALATKVGAKQCGKGVPALAGGVRSPLVSHVTAREIYLANGAVEVVFDRLHATPGLIKTLRASASKARTDLLWRTSGYAWQGFEFTPGGTWSAGEITVDNAFRKTVTFANEKAELDFTLYANAPRVDYAYRLKAGEKNAGITVSWAPGEGCANDDFYYVGLAGKLLTFRAALDEVTDCMPQLELYSFPWLAQGWYAIRDHVTRDVVGHVFDG